MELIEDGDVVRSMCNAAGGGDSRCFDVREAQDLLGLGTCLGKPNNKCFDEELVGYIHDNDIHCLVMLDSDGAVSALFVSGHEGDEYVIEYLIRRNGGSARFDSGCDPVFHYDREPFTFFEVE